MEEWLSMEIMQAAHEVGLQKLKKLSEVIAELESGVKTEAIETLEDLARFFEADLRMHFRHEEQALFPAMAKVIGRRGPIEAMLEEHDSLWRAIDTYNEVLQGMKTADAKARIGAVPALGRVTKHIVWLLTSHIQKEDSMLFPLAEKILDEAGRREVDENVGTLETMYGANV